MSFIILLCLLGTNPCLSQVNAQQDTLYERLKKKDINKMTQREYDYFMLMKRKDQDAQNPPVEKPGTLSVVTTYRFNRNLGDVPDVGATLYILPQQFQDRWAEAFFFYSDVLLRASINLSRELGIPDSRTPMPQARFEHLEGRVLEFIDQLTGNQIPEAQKLIADGNGFCSITLPPGKYYLIAHSAHRTSNANKVEIDGQINVKMVVMKADNKSSIAFSFGDR